MTLSVGDKVVKLDTNGEPIKDGESYVEYEVVDLGGHINLRPPSQNDEETYLMTLLRVIR